MVARSNTFAVKGNGDYTSRLPLTFTIEGTFDAEPEFLKKKWKDTDTEKLTSVLQSLPPPRSIRNPLELDGYTVEMLATINEAIEESVPVARIIPGRTKYRFTPELSAQLLMHRQLRNRLRATRWDPELIPQNLELLKEYK